jgi:hypothetical protein
MSTIVSMFQADLPIGRHLWIALLTVVLIITFSGQPLSLPDLKPQEFVIEALLIYGYVILLTVAIYLPLFLVTYRVVLARFNKELSLEEFFLAKTGRQTYPFLARVAFPVAVAATLFSYNPALTHRWGPFGVLLILLVYVISPTTASEWTKQTLILNWRKDEVLFALLLSKGQTEAFSLSIDKDTVTRWLTRSGWEIEDATADEAACQILFKRDKPPVTVPTYSVHWWRFQ